MDKISKVIIILIFAAFIFVVALKANGNFDSQPISGVVVEKIHQPANSDFHSGAGKIPSFWTRTSEKWILVVQDSQEQLHKVSIDQAFWDNINIGDFFIQDTRP